MNKSAARLALICALVGLGASAAASYVHYHLLRDPSYLSFCDVSATVSCTQVYSSRYGTMAGVPVAIFGAIWFAVATLLSVAGLTARPAVQESVPGYLFGGAPVWVSGGLSFGLSAVEVVGKGCNSWWTHISARSW